MKSSKITPSLKSVFVLNEAAGPGKAGDLAAQLRKEGGTEFAEVVIHILKTLGGNTKSPQSAMRGMADPLGDNGPEEPSNLSAADIRSAFTSVKNLNAVKDWVNSDKKGARKLVLMTRDPDNLKTLLKLVTK